MNVATARGFVQQFGRTPSGDTSAYSLDDIDRSIQAACDDFLAVAPVCRGFDQEQLGSNEVELALPDGFEAEQVYEVYTEDADEIITYLPIKSLPEVYAERLKNASPGHPTMIAFTDETNAAVDYIGDALNFIFYRREPLLLRDGDGALVDWTIGSEAAPTTTAVINVPDRYLRTILIYGATAILQHVDVEQRFMSEAWKKYVEFRDKCALAARGTPRIKSAARSMILES